MRNNRWFLVMLLILIAVFGARYLTNSSPQESRVRQLILSNTKNQTISSTADKISDDKIITGNIIILGRGVEAGIQE
jgi:hypothetical protein